MPIYKQWINKTIVKEKYFLATRDVCIHDNRGWSALDYALNINGPQKDDIVHMLLKVLTKTGDKHTHTHTSL